MSMTTQNRRNSGTSLMKRHASENVVGKSTALPPHMAKKRPALANVTNQRPVSHNAPRNTSILVPCAVKLGDPKKGSLIVDKKAFCHGKSTTISSNKNTFIARKDESDIDVSPSQSVSMDETMSSSDSLNNSPDVEYIDNDEIAATDSIDRNICTKLNISDHVEATGKICKIEIVMKTGTCEKIVDLDDNFMDPQLCATITCDIYQHLRASEATKRPSIDYMEKVQRDINASMRAILIDWLVEVAEEYRLVPDTLYLTINYIDRYLSGNLMDKQRLQLLGIACMMIAAKYEEICAPQVEEFCYITDNTYFKDEVLQMESTVLNFLKFELTAPTTRCFLRRFVRAAQGVNEAPSLQFECLVNYIAELSLVEYDMLCYAPSVVAASAIFLAQYILVPSKTPWNSTLRHYTRYQPSDIYECVMALHRLCCESPNSNLPAVREKYSQHKYKFVAKKCCPPSIPSEYFQNVSSN